MASTSRQAEILSSSTSTQPCLIFSLAEIQSATNDFDDKLIVGHGGFGKVYKGLLYIQETDQVVAIKKLDYMSNQGAPEFWDEIEMLSKLRHCHLVSLIGYCDDNKEMILVYEYMHRGSLYDHLHKVGTHLSWVQRLKITIGAARGLDYLHTGVGTQHGIIHRDVKSSNILLDENWAAMISDFGLSKISPTNQSLSYVDASVKGTFGYLDPEYFYTRRLTRKTDVYAFGVVLFELLSGRLPVDISYGEEQCSLVRWAQKCVKERKLDQMVDSNIRGTIFPKCLRQFAQISYQCLINIPTERPTMTEVVASLQGCLEFQQKYEDPATSSCIIGLTSKMQNYFGFPTKMKSDHVGTSKSSGDNIAIGNAEEKMKSVTEKVFGRFLMSPKVNNNIGSVHLTMRQVARATKNFSPSLRIGHGGLGTVYKAHLDDGQVVAIKRKKKEYLDDQRRSEHRSEVEMLVKIDHLNLVKLLGYVDKGNEHLFIMEYVPNGTLREHLDGVHGSFLDFSQRIEISVDIAHALMYLHLYEEKQIVHRDLTSSNVLLTERLKAKVSDFGFGRLENGLINSALVVSDVKKTVGYLDPDYMSTYQLTPKSNVYSFGIILIEILSGRSPIQLMSSTRERVTLRWAFKKYNEGEVMDLVDPQMKEAIDREIFVKILGLAFRCAAPTMAERPEMMVVAEQLRAYRTDHLINGRRG